MYGAVGGALSNGRPYPYLARSAGARYLTKSAPRFSAAQPPRTPFFSSRGFLRSAGKTLLGAFYQ